MRLSPISELEFFEKIAVANERVWASIDGYFQEQEIFIVNAELFLGSNSENIISQIKQDHPEEADMFRDYFAHRVMYDFEKSDNADEQAFYKKVNMMAGRISSNEDPKSKIDFAKYCIHVVKTVDIAEKLTGDIALYQKIIANELADFLNNYYWYQKNIRPANHDGYYSYA